MHDVFTLLESALCIYTTRECTQGLLPIKYNVIISGVQSPLKSTLSVNLVYPDDPAFDRQLCVQTLALNNNNANSDLN